MLYVERDEKGSIIALHQTPGEKAAEQKSIMDEEILAFLDKHGRTDPWVQLLSLSDIGIIRILEDLIDVLMKKKVIMFTDLPEEAQIKIKDRKRVRQRMENQNIVVDDIL